MVVTEEQLPAWRHGLQGGIDSEREAIVEWLRAFHWTHQHKIAATFFAELIEHGVHLPLPPIPADVE